MGKALSMAVVAISGLLSLAPSAQSQVLQSSNTYNAFCGTDWEFPQEEGWGDITVEVCPSAENSIYRMNFSQETGVLTIWTGAIKPIGGGYMGLDEQSASL